MPLLANISDSRVDREDVKHYNNAFQIAFREKGILEIRAGVTQSFLFCKVTPIVSTLKKTPKGGKLKMPFENLLNLNRFSKKIL